MTESELVSCPKGCGTRLPITAMHDHYETCKGANPLVADILKTIPQQVPTWPVAPPAPKPYVEPERVIKTEHIVPSFCKKCGTEFIENAYYKVCIKCKTIKTKKRMFWWIIFRYGFMIAWICLFAGFILGIYSYHKIYG
jgi:hypothetical protein